MAIGPRFSAQKFTQVMQNALGAKGSGAVRQALTHLGAQRLLQNGATVKDVREVISKMKKEGTVQDADHAERVLKTEERIAARVQQNRETERRKDYVAEYMAASQAAGDSVVREQAHGVSIISDKSSGQHLVSIGQKNNQNAKSSSTQRPATPPQIGIVQNANQKAKPFIDVAID